MTDAAFFDLPASAYPLLCEVWLLDDPDDAKPRWREVVAGPGALAIPGFGRPTRVRITTGDWQVYQS